LPEGLIIYFGSPKKVKCDGNCKKAWGRDKRPRIQLSDNEDDYEFLIDSELGDAPIDSGTHEGDHAKHGYP